MNVLTFWATIQLLPPLQANFLEAAKEHATGRIGSAGGAGTGVDGSRQDRKDKRQRERRQPLFAGLSVSADPAGLRRSGPGTARTARLLARPYQAQVGGTRSLRSSLSPNAISDFPHPAFVPSHRYSRGVSRRRSDAGFQTADHARYR